MALFFVVLVNPDKRAGRGAGMLADLKEGVAYATSHVPIKQLFLMLIFIAVFLRAYMELLPGISDTMFSRGADGVAILVSAAGFGAMVGSLAVGNITRRQTLLRTYFASVLIAVLALVLFTSTNIFWIAVAAAAIPGGISARRTLAGNDVHDQRHAPVFRRTRQVGGVVADERVDVGDVRAGIQRHEQCLAMAGAKSGRCGP